MWLSVAEAKKRYNKSESSIRRIIKELKQVDISQLQFETLANGVEKISINSEYLDTCFDRKKNTTKTSSSSNGSNDMVNYLLNELEQKNKQIEQLHILLGNFQSQVLEIDAPKSKWWKRNK